MPQVIDGLFFHASMLLPIVVAAYQTVEYNLPVMISAAVSLLLSIVLRTIIARKRMPQFFADIPAWKIVPLEIWQTFQKLIHWLAYKRADKYDFITHKI